jgi:AraC-like DNA-binding protein
VDEASFEPPFAKERMRALLLGLLTELARSQSAAQPRNLLSRSQRARIAQVVGEASRRWPAPSDLARAVELSPDYFTRCFRRTYNVPPRRWLLEERMRLATVRLLESNATISQLARELGYEDVFTFSRVFKSVHGLSPTHYRQQHGTVGTL